MILRALGIQGLAGLIVAAALAILLMVQKSETRRWQIKSARFEQLHQQSEAALSGTIANYRAAAERARAADRAAAERVQRAQHSINERIEHDLQTRLADARDRADRLRASTAPAGTGPGAGGSAPVSALAAGSRGADETAGENRLSASDALIATEQAIQLDELIRWVRAQQAVRTDGSPH